MEWRDEALLLSLRPHGESAAIIEVLTAAHGRHLGLVRGGGSRRYAPILQVGAQLAVEWRARSSEQLGQFRVEPVKSRAAVLEDPFALAGLASLCAMLRFCLPERLPYPQLYARSQQVLDLQAGGKTWLPDYLRWEMTLLEDIGFGLDLSRCAVTGSRDDLAYVSPRTGRAVSRKGAGEWADRLFPLPQSLLGQGPADWHEALQALRITGHFLSREVDATQGLSALPDARLRLLSRLEREARAAGQ